MSTTGWGLSFIVYSRGVDMFFKTLAIQYFHSPSHKTTDQKYRKGLVRRGKKLARLASGFVFLLANPEFYSHLASGYPQPLNSSLATHHHLPQN
jgi:hypothetical protein